MRTIRTRAFLPCLVIIGCGSIPSARATSNDVAQIRALEDRLAVAAEARDLDAIMKSYVPDESLFVFDVIPPRQYVGAKAFRKDWDEFLGSTKGPLKYTITDLEVTTVGIVGYGHSIQQIAGTGAKGYPVNLTTRVSDVYRKIKGNWVIVQEHISIPVDLDTGRPDFSSRP
jgi:ketosteroid isomerase-like protein